MCWHYANRLDALEDLADGGAAGVAGAQVLHELVEAGQGVHVVGDELADVPQLRLQALVAGQVADGGEVRRQAEHQLGAAGAVHVDADDGAHLKDQLRVQLARARVLGGYAIAQIEVVEVLGVEQLEVALDPARRGVDDLLAMAGVTPSSPSSSRKPRPGWAVAKVARNFSRAPVPK